MKEEQQRAEIIFNILKSMTPYQSGYDRAHLLAQLAQKNQRQRLMNANKSNTSMMRKGSASSLSNLSSEKSQKQTKLKNTKKVSFGEQVLVNNELPISSVIHNQLFTSKMLQKKALPQRTESQIIQKDLINLQSSIFSKFKIPQPKQYDRRLPSTKNMPIINSAVSKFISPTSQFVNLIHNSKDIQRNCGQMSNSPYLPMSSSMHLGTSTKIKNFSQMNSASHMKNSIQTMNSRHLKNEGLQNNSKQLRNAYKMKNVEHFDNQESFEFKNKAQMRNDDHLQNSAQFSNRRTTISRFSSESMLMRYRHIQDQNKRELQTNNMFGTSNMSKSQVFNPSKRIQNNPQSLQTSDKMQISTLNSKSRVTPKNLPMRSSSARSLPLNPKIEKQKFNLQMEIFKRKLDSKFKFK